MRHGTVSIIAARNFATGEVITQPVTRNDSVAFIRFLSLLDQCTGSPSSPAVALRPLAQMIIEIERPHPVRVGADGFSGVGKSTLADELAAMVTGQGRSCLRADLDDFKRPRAERPAGPEGFYRGAFDLDAIRTVLLAPLGPGGDRQIRLRFLDQQHQASFPRRCSRCPPTRS